MWTAKDMADQPNSSCQYGPSRAAITFPEAHGIEARHDISIRFGYVQTCGGLKDLVWIPYLNGPHVQSCFIDR